MKKQNGIQTDLTQEQISLLEDLINHDLSWIDIPGALFRAALLYIRSEEIEGDPAERRSEFALNLEVIRDLFEKITKVQSLAPTEDPSKKFEECPSCIKKEGVIEHLQARIDDLTSGSSGKSEGECRTVLMG